MSDSGKLWLWIGAAAVGIGALLYSRKASAAADTVPDGTDAGTDAGTGADDSATPPPDIDIGALQIDLPSLGGVIATVTGSTRGIRNHNPGNLRYLPPVRAWDGQTDNDGGYAVYVDDQHGVRALARQLLRYRDYGYKTIRDIITHWAPPTENLTTAYVNDVSARLGIAPDAAFDVSANITALVSAVIWHENGQNPYDPNDLDAWAHS